MAIKEIIAIEKTKSKNPTSGCTLRFCRGPKTPPVSLGYSSEKEIREGKEREHGKHGKVCGWIFNSYR